MSAIRPFAIGCALAIAPLFAAPAQGPLGQAPGPFDGVVHFDVYVARHDLSFPNMAGRPEGTGFRVMAPLSSADGGRRERLLEHVSVGGYFEVAKETRPGTNARLRQEVYAAEVEVRPLRAPLAGRLEPIVGIATGLIRLEEINHPPKTLSSPTRPPYTTSTMSERALLAPSAGVLLRVTRNVGLRFDVRELMVSGSGDAGSTQMATGVRLSF